MYELTRVRLFSVGPPGARYQDVTLDLRGVGEPVPVASRQDTLFAPDSLDDTPRRPAPASVLFLENGGGKSVLLKLVFSVLLPGRRQIVGTSSTSVLEKFVLAEDVAHVACEWMHTRTGQLLVTGKVSEWRGHVASSDPEKLANAWYSFRPAPGFGLDDLPVTDSGRRVTTTGLRERLTERQREVPALEVTWETGPGDWTRHLVDVGLDPELFRYQREMNAGEGEAAETFSFPSDEAFVDFLLRAVLDPDEPRMLADLVAGYADKLAERSGLEQERDFVEGTLERLSPLAAAERTAAAARAAEVVALGRASQVAVSIVARRAVEDERVASASAVVEETGRARAAADREEQELTAVVTELRRLVAVREHEAAHRVEQAAREAKDEAERAAAAWQAVEPVLALRVAAAEADRLRVRVADEQERARPALQARGDAARAFAAGLDATAGAASGAASAAEREARAADERAAQARDAELGHSRTAETQRGEAGRARADLAAIDAGVARAVGDGLLVEGRTSPTQVRAVHDDAVRAAEDAVRAAEGARAEATRRRRDRRTAETRRDELQAAAHAAETTAERAGTALRDAVAARGALAGEPRLAELLGVDEIRPDTDAAPLTDRLRAAIASGDDRRTALLAERDRVARTLTALGTGGLLPAPAEVEAVLAVLEDEGITAYAGWRYLAMLAPDRRADVLQRLPHLISGVLLNDAADAGRAREELERARLLPCAAIAVAPTTALTDDTAAAAAVEFVVEPNPAMYDEDIAADTRRELEHETVERAEELAALTQRLESDRSLLARLRSWREQHPEGEEAVLEDALDTARERARSARAAAAAAGAEIARLDEAADRLDDAAPVLATAVEDARTRSRALAALVEQVGKRSELGERARIADADAASATSAEQAARADAETARQDAATHRTTHERKRGVAERLRAERAALPVEGHLPEPGDLPLDVLRSAYVEADRAYRAAEVDADLRALLQEAERAARVAQNAVDELPEGAVGAAEALLRTDDAADVAARRRAADQARQLLNRRAADLGEASTGLAVALREVRAFTAAPRDVAPYAAPIDAAHGREQVVLAETDRSAAVAAAETARDAHTAAESGLRGVQGSAEGFRRAVDSLEEAPAPEPGAAPFDGTVDDALAAWKQARAAVRSAAGDRSAAEKGVRGATDAVAQFAQETRFSTVGSPVRAHVLGVGRTEMPALAAEWEQALRPRLRSLNDDLATITRHRSGIVTRLQGMVVEALRTLRLAQRLSELPDGLSDWSGQQFLRIKFDELADAALAHELGEVVDRVAEERGTARARRDGLSLLLRGVRASTPKGVRVEMLKPDAVLRTERLRVSEIRDVFSGGQQLTAAIVLYCTMAALRAHQRGHGRRPHAGVLFLDNPIGRASAGYLLELQFGVARALGVQLVYTTGLFDAGALAAFPLIIRLRNDADLRAGRKYLSVADRAARALDALPGPDGTGQVTAGRLFRRPAPVTP